MLWLELSVMRLEKWLAPKVVLGPRLEKLIPLAQQLTGGAVRKLQLELLSLPAEQMARRTPKMPRLMLHSIGWAAHTQQLEQRPLLGMKQAG